MSKWVEAMALPTNDRWMVTQFLWKNIFSWCSTLRALFSDEKNHSCNRQFVALLADHFKNRTKIFQTSRFDEF